MEGRCGTSSLLQETRLKRLGPAPPPGCAPGVESHLGENVSLTEQVCCRPGRPVTSRQAVQTLAVGLAPPFQGGVAGPSGRIRKAVVGAWQVGGAVPHVLLSLLTAGLSPATPPGPPCSRCKHFHIRQAPWSPPLTVTSGDSFCGPGAEPPLPRCARCFLGHPCDRVSRHLAKFSERYSALHLVFTLLTQTHLGAHERSWYPLSTRWLRHPATGAGPSEMGGGCASLFTPALSFKLV